MRVSTLRDDPGFRSDADRFDVYFDGLRMTADAQKRMGMFIVTADEDAGEVVFHPYTESGHLEMDPRTRQPVQRSVHGRVWLRAPFKSAT
jgi:hypothetical protein